MEKIKHTPKENFKNVIIVLLTLTMLTLAVIYIGGSQFATDGAALKAEKLPVGATPVGVAENTDTAIYNKKLLPISYVGIKYGKNGGGVTSNEVAAEALIDFACENIHLCLESGNTVEKVSSEELAAAFDGNFLVINLSSALPYQIIYALTGEYNSSAMH